MQLHAENKLAGGYCSLEIGSPLSSPTGRPTVRTASDLEARLLLPRMAGFSLGLGRGGKKARAMPLVTWNSICNSTPRPFLIRAQLESVVAHSQCAVFKRFLDTMDWTGNYALYPGLAFVWTLFDLQVDARQVVRAVNARETEQCPAEWATMWTFELNGAALATIRSQLLKSERTAQNGHGLVVHKEYRAPRIETAGGCFLR